MRAGLQFTSLLLCALAWGCAEPTIEGTTVLADTEDTGGPYRVSTVIQGVDRNDRVQLYYNTVDDRPEHYVPRLMEPVDPDDARPSEFFVGEIPGSPAGAMIRYYVAVVRDGELVSQDPESGDLRPFVFRIAP